MTACLSQGFTNVNGYSRREAIGHNCRFLQTDASDPAAVRALRTAVERGEAACIHLYNEDRKRTGFWSVISLHPAVGDDRIETAHLRAATPVEGAVTGASRGDSASPGRSLTAAEAPPPLSEGRRAIAPMAAPRLPPTAPP